MASIGHVAIGLLASKLRKGGWASALGFSALSLLPDADVIGFAMGVPYGAPWGHRGATHSFVFAGAVALVVSLFGKRGDRAALGLTTFAVVASHGLLDALTDGGRGIALFWPFSNARHFAPIRPIPVAPIGVRILSPRGLHVMATEALMFAPVFLYALWPRKTTSNRAGSA